MNAPTAAREIIARVPRMPFDVAGILAPDDPLRDRLLEWRPYYDFVHVDGQQDEAGSAHDLALAMRRGRWVLVDGYGYSGQVKRAVDTRLGSNGIKSVAFIDDYAVEVLIQPTRGIA